MGKRVLVGMSGGVDSSVAAALLVEAGYEVIGVTLNVWPEHDPTQALVERADACCALGAVEDARRVAAQLGIPYYVLNFREVFRRTVMANFAAEYARGRTPNPCVRCNQFVKFDALLARAAALDADYVATGHYARIDRDPASGRWRLRKAVDRHKDQSYVLYVLSQERLARTLFPLGERAKAEVRALAARLGLVTATKPESQEICFVPANDYRAYLARVAPETRRSGPIVDLAGRVLGQHEGIAYYTIGQRRGLGLAVGEPLYVVDILAEENTLVVGPREALFAEGCLVEDVNWVALPPLAEPLAAAARIRYRAEEVACLLAPAGADQLVVRFAAPQRAVTPGQAIVFYADDVVLAGGTIARRLDAREWAEATAAVGAAV
ncbi:MAG TPA: tRNA 2-thiouridine(34) synthase MnmA [Chloroflexota bacterium]|nr:tRNA 2-thiouridine(34) synthase MnmA [Chloroflexota bacterium]